MSSFARGTRIGERYRLVNEIGRGGMGTVWCAYDEVLERLVAVKLMASGGEQLRKEARAAARLSHPHITSVYDYGESPPYIVMELLEGDTLAARLTTTPPDPATARTIAGQIASALAAAHRRGVVHRDVTPGNVVLTPAGAKVVDFGISTIGHAETATHGTPKYLAPEVLAGAPATPESDVYSFGVILGELVPRDHPAEHAELAELAELQAHCRSAAPGDRPTMAEIAGTLVPTTSQPANGAAPPPPSRTRLLTDALTTRFRTRGKSTRTQNRNLATLLATTIGAIAIILLLVFALNRPDRPSTAAPTKTTTPPASPVAPPAELEVRVQNAGAAEGQQINAYFDLFNRGKEPIKLSQVTIRYWFSADDDPATFQAECDYAVRNRDNIRRGIEVVTDGRDGADRVLVLGFGAGASWLNPGESTGQIQIRVHKQDWTNLDQSDDYSYQLATTYAAAPKVTAYVAGKLAWGREPT
ncbi:protein kinase domain-containing protein [Flindersiella endophytica]